MDNVEFGALLGVVMNLPDKDITRAETAAENAESYAERAEYAAEQIIGLNYDISVTGTELSIVGRSGNNG